MADGRTGGAADTAGGPDDVRGGPPDRDFYDNLRGSLDHAWALLTRGVGDRRSPFHTPVVATIGTDGAPAARTVVLRAADPLAWRLRFHTDRRSGKTADLLADPRIGVVAYDPRSKIQLRLTGTASLHFDDGIAKAAWEGSRTMSRACYAQAVGPGMAVAEPTIAAAADPAGDLFGRANFVAVVIAVTRVEWLYLAHSGHRRAIFELDAAGDVESRWLAP